MIMSIRHHPDDEILAAYAAGTLDFGKHVAIATHLVSCPRCRGFVRAIEHVGGSMLESLPPQAMAEDAFARVSSLLGAAREPGGPRIAAVAEPAAAGLPAFVRGYEFGSWKWIAPRVRLRPIKLPVPSDARVFLLKSGPGTKMLQHSHTGTEMTCVLSGAFHHDGGRFGPGDFDYGDDTVDHRPLVDVGEDCVCLIAMQGELRLNGLIGRLVQPFVHL
jgi:putative transcriptional regulator